MKRREGAVGGAKATMTDQLISTSLADIMVLNVYSVELDYSSLR